MRLNISFVRVRTSEAEPALMSPSTPSCKPKTGDPQRDKLAVGLGEALALVLNEVGEDAEVIIIINNNRHVCAGQLYTTMFPPR
jgi:hypothetical protein